MDRDEDDLRILGVGLHPGTVDELHDKLDKTRRWNATIEEYDFRDADYKSYEEFDSSSLDLAVIEYRAPSSGGMDFVRLNLVRQIRLNHPDLPLLMLAKGGNERLAVEALKSGCDDYRRLDDLGFSEVINSIKYALENRSRMQELRRKSRIDDQTGLFNREQMMETIGNEIKDAIRHGRTLFVCMVDLDDFKSVNDQYGHMSGDKVLKETSDIIKQELRAGDSAGRYGGDEFVLLIADTDHEGARSTVQRILDRIEETNFEVFVDQTDEQSQTVSMTASVGITDFHGSDFEQTETLDDLPGVINRADKSLYQVKEKGGNGIERRRYERKDVRTFPVQIGYASKKHDAELMDYSAGGVKLRLLPMASVGETIDIYFEVENEQRLKRRAEVEWSIEDQQNQQMMMGLNVSVPVEKLSPSPPERKHDVDGDEATWTYRNSG